MQDSWQVLMKPAVSTSHVDATFQAGVHAAAASMAGRVLFPHPRWSDIAETDGCIHDKHVENNLVTMANSTAIAKQLPVEGLGYCKVSNNLLDATQLQGGASMGGRGLVCAKETEKTAQYTTTHENLGLMAMVAGGVVKAEKHNAFFNSALNSIRSSHNHSPVGALSTMAPKIHLQEMTMKQDMDVGKKIRLANSKNDMHITSTYNGGVISNSKCKQNVVHHHLTAHAMPRCQIDGCKQDLNKAKEYHRRHKVCEMHSKASSVLKYGLNQRFCQQCSRFHVVGDFDDAKRSCRRRLEGHNRRRRKSISQGYGNLIHLNQAMHHHLIARTTMMVPIQQQVLLNQESNNIKAAYLQETQYQNLLAISNNTLTSNFDERLASLLTYSSKNASLSSSSSPSPIFHHGDSNCALSLLSCQAHLNQPLEKLIEENPLNPNIYNNLTTTNNFKSPHITNSTSRLSLKAYNPCAIEYPQHLQPNSQTICKIESPSIVESSEDLAYNYPSTNSWKNLDSLLNMEQHHNANFVDELLRELQAYSHHNSHI